MDIRDLRIVAVDHPALDRDVERFVEQLRSEPKFLCPTAAVVPEPFASLIERLEGRSGFRLGVVECGLLIGLARVDRAGRLSIAVCADRRGHGVGELLGRAVLRRAIQLGHRRIRIRTTARTEAVERIARSLGCATAVSEFGVTDVLIATDDEAGPAPTLSAARSRRRSIAHPVGHEKDPTGPADRPESVGWPTSQNP